jgi:pimeloyl-ACP methyl ester carboxylesterase
MKRIASSFALGLLLTTIFNVGMAQQPSAAQQVSSETKYVDVGGHKLRMKVAGSGNPVVILDCGFGDVLEAWDDVFPEIARFTRVVAYDRAGLGKSDPGPEPRSFTQIATELHTLLQRANISPPYVLVGHSMGGANIRAFAHLFKDDVVGLVFVDPFNEHIFRSVPAQVRDAEMARQEAALKNGPSGARAEWTFLKDEVLHNFPQLTSFDKPPDVPMMLLVAGRGRPPHWVKSVLEQYGSWIADATEGGALIIPDSRHHIQRDEPDSVVSAIKRVVFPSVQNSLARVIKEKGVDAAVDFYRQIRKRYPAESFKERELNSLGYEQLQARHVREAIALLQLNVEMYPNRFNTYDSLAEAYMVQGDHEAAIKNYRKSLALNPGNTNAVGMLKKLGSLP